MGRINFISLGIGEKTFHGLILLFISLILLFGCGEKQILTQPSSVLTGADLLLSENFELIKNKKIGIVTNHTAVLSNGVHLVDTLFARNDVEIIKLFGPEHGIRGDAPDGHTITDGIDTKTGIQVISLYGKLRKPTPEMLNEIEVLVFDIQDVGARFYTFISTMYYAIQAAAENNIPIVILDRPNPINGITVAGPMLDTNFKSFVGITELPIQHGMTVGELAQFFNRTEILETEKSAELIIVKMQNWKREFYYDDCNLEWIKPSPNMPNLETAIAYPGLCLIEGTNISEGRGTYSPFLIIGSPFINSRDVISKMKNYNLDGVTISDTSFTPISIPNMSTSPKYLDENCNGISINISDRNLFKPIDFTVNLIYTFHKLYPQKFTFRESSIDRLWGSDKFRKDILADKTPKEIIESYQNDLENFKQVRKEFLLY